MATKGDISDLDEFKFGGEPILPLLNGFSRHRVSGVVQSDTNGGLTRQNKKFYNQPYLADVSYDLPTPVMQDFIKVFFERNEGKKFVAWLRADRPLLEPYVVQVVSDWNDDYASAIDGTTSFTLEIASVRDTALDDLLFELYQSYGEDYMSYLDAFRPIVEAMPNG